MLSCSTCLAVGVALALLFYAVLPWLLLPVRPLTCRPDEALVLITGVSSIIGKDAALHFASQGYQVLGTVPSLEAAELLQQHQNLAVVVCEGGSGACREELTTALAQQQAKGRHLFALVVCDGILPRDLRKADLANGTAATVTADAHSRNVLAPLQLVGMLLPRLELGAKACGSARVVNVGSLAGVVSLPRQLAFAATAGALERVADSLRHALRDLGIAVSLVQPGFVERGQGSAWHQRATAHDTTTPAIFHAVTGMKPRTRYPCAAAYGLPSRIIADVVPMLPEAVLDALLIWLDSEPALGRNEL